MVNNVEAFEACFKAGDERPGTVELFTDVAVVVPFGVLFVFVFVFVSVSASFFAGVLCLFSSPSVSEGFFNDSDPGSTKRNRPRPVVRLGLESEFLESLISLPLHLCSTFPGFSIWDTARGGCSDETGQWVGRGSISTVLKLDLDLDLDFTEDDLWMETGIFVFVLILFPFAILVKRLKWM